jgi:predicted GH43/DUF377 family glycosyl hydrolase
LNRAGFAGFLGIALMSANLIRADADESYFVLVPSTERPSDVPLKVENVLPAPVLGRGPGHWDAVDALNPSVIRFQGKLFNYYSGYDGTVWRTGLATSLDGLHWEKSPANPILSPSKSDWDVSIISANGSAIVVNGKVFYFYQGVDKNILTQIGLATSDDGVHFTKRPAPVFTVGAAHSWESAAVADPYVIQRDGYLYLYYLGQDDLGVQRLGVARSSDGIAWERSITNPILDVGARGTFDENGLGEPAVAYSSPYFYMLYTGRSASEMRNLGYAVSTDGVHWKKISSAGLLTATQRGVWASQVVCDPTLLPRGNGKWSVWFGGGDKAEVAQNLNGQRGGRLGRYSVSPPLSGSPADWLRNVRRSGRLAGRA